MKNILESLYGKDQSNLDYQKNRFKDAIDKFKDLFPDNNKDFRIFSTPGRSEIGGNHTDHNHGRVLAAGVNLDSLAIVSPRSDKIVNLHSKGYSKKFFLDLSDLSILDAEKGTTLALIRGIAFKLKDLGYNIGGFDAYITSDVLRGSGLSSSASIEVLIGTIFNYIYNDGKISPEKIAIIGQFAENEYFGKPSGLMDQMACSVGGFVFIDFKDPKDPKVQKVEFDFEAEGYSLLVVDTGGNHANLTEDYASIPQEMRDVAKLLGAKVLRELTREDIIDNILDIRKKINDRAALRALHFVYEDERVVKEVNALLSGDFNEFLSHVRDSGNSSWKWLQNVYTTHNPLEQGITLALALTEDYIARIGEGASRVHGGGFAGTIQVFLPDRAIDAYIEEMEAIFSKGAVSKLNIRDEGSIELKKDVLLAELDR